MIDSAAGLQALLDRIDAIMMGTADVDYSKLMMQLDSTTGRYEHIGEQTLGHKEPTLRLVLENTAARGRSTYVVQRRIGHRTEHGPVVLRRAAQHATAALGVLGLPRGVDRGVTETRHAPNARGRAGAAPGSAPRPALATERVRGAQPALGSRRSMHLHDGAVRALPWQRTASSMVSSRKSALAPAH